MRTSRILFVMAILAMTNTLFSTPSQQPHEFSITMIESFAQAQPLLDQCDANSIVFLDVDDTLITANDFMARHCSYPAWFRLKAVLRYPRLLFNHRLIDHCLSIIFDQARRYVMEPEIISIINVLKAKGCLVFGLTAMESGSFGVIPSMPEWRYTMLKKLGIEFSDNYGDVTFTKFPFYRKSKPCLYNGILCCNQESKGKVVGSFLDTFDVKTSNISFFDDRLRCVRSVYNECKRRNIRFKGYVYSYKKTLPGSWNTKRSLVQLRDIMKENKWISDQEADKRLKVKRGSVV